MYKDTPTYLAQFGGDYLYPDANRDVFAGNGGNAVSSIVKIAVTLTVTRPQMDDFKLMLWDVGLCLVIDEITEIESVE